MGRKKDVQLASISDVKNASVGKSKSEDKNLDLKEIEVESWKDLTWKCTTRQF